MQDNKSHPLILAHSVKGQMSYWDFNQHSEQPQTRSDHKRIVPAIQDYDTPVDLGYP